MCGERCAFGMMNGNRLTIDLGKLLFVTIKISLVAFKYFSLYTAIRIN